MTALLAASRRFALAEFPALAVQRNERRTALASIDSPETGGHRPLGSHAHCAAQRHKLRRIAFEVAVASDSASRRTARYHDIPIGRCQTERPFGQFGSRPGAEVRQCFEKCDTADIALAGAALGLVSRLPR